MKYYLIITSVIITSILLFACQKEEGFNFTENTQTKYDINELKFYLVEEGYSEEDIKVDEDEKVLRISDMRFPFKSIQKGINYNENNEVLKKNRASRCNWPPISQESFNKGRRQSEMFEINVGVNAGVNGSQTWPQLWIDAIEDGIDHWNSYANRTVRFNFITGDVGDGIIVSRQNIGPAGFIADAFVGMNGDIGHSIRINDGYQGWDENPIFVGSVNINPNAISYQRKVAAIAHELGHTIGYFHTDENDGCRIREYRGRRAGWWNSPTSGGLMESTATVLSNAGDIESHNVVYKWSPICNRPHGSTAPCTWTDPPLIRFD